MGKLKVLAVIVAAVIAMTVASPSQAQLFGRKKDESNVRLNEMEERLRRITGQLEQLSFQMRELQDQMRRMQEDNEYRFQQLEGGKPGKRSDAAPSGQRTIEPQLTDGVQTLGTLSSGGSGDGNWADTGGYENGAAPGLPGDGPIDLSALAGGLTSVGSGTDGLGPDQGRGRQSTGEIVAALPTSGDPRSDYDRAYSLAVNGQYDAAEDGFRSFVEAYPDHKLAANAQYWLGESLLAQQNYRDAADAFLKTYTDHPGNSKGPDSLLKLGLSLSGLGEGDAACATYAELLSKFPGAAPAVLNQARDEQRRAQCS